MKGKSYYFYYIRKKVLERDNFQCQLCKTKKKRLTVHHLDGKGMNLPYRKRNNKIDNLITVCYPCHRKLDIFIGLRKKYTYKLSKGKWSRKYDFCIFCKKNNSKYSHSGMCRRCYELTRRKYKREWAKKHYLKRNKRS